MTKQIPTDAFILVSTIGVLVNVGFMLNLGLYQQTEQKSVHLMVFEINKKISTNFNIKCNLFYKTMCKGGVLTKQG